jgi:alkylation response protein AidB-like acyl-CoA dehydrogenase
MDFTFEETQQAVIRLASEVLEKQRSSPERNVVPATAQSQQQWKEQQWKELGQAGLLALSLPDWLGGDGLGVLDTAVLLTEIGKQALPLPALATLMTGVLPVVRWGNRDLQRTLLDGVSSGDVILTAAVRETSDPAPLAPATTASQSAGPVSAGPVSAGPVSAGPVSAGTVSGVKIGVPYCAAADWILVPASFATGSVGVVIVDRSAEGVSLTLTHSSGADPEYTLRLDQAPFTHILGLDADGDRVVRDLYQLALAGACCLADGAVSAALDLTTSHVGSRQQFGKPLAAFQAVAQQIADVYIAARTLHLATLSACWRLATGRDAGRDLDVAAYWLADQAPAALRTCHHLHGGIGMDVTYPLPRYSALVRDLVRLVGGADYRLDQLAGSLDVP